ncbi:MAG: OadG family protein [Gammaproteobacteria bacterium]
MTELMSSGVELMLVGMGIVYLFLAMLVIAISLMSSFLQRFFPEETTALKLKTGETDKATIAAISAAVHHYRNKK